MVVVLHSFFAFPSLDLLPFMTFCVKAVFYLFLRLRYPFLSFLLLSLPFVYLTTLISRKKEVEGWQENKKRPIKTTPLLISIDCFAMVGTLFSISLHFNFAWNTAGNRTQDTGQVLKRPRLAGRTKVRTESVLTTIPHATDQTTSYTTPPANSKQQQHAAAAAPRTKQNVSVLATPSNRIEPTWHRLLCSFCWFVSICPCAQTTNQSQL